MLDTLQLPVSTVLPLQEEAPLLDERLGRYVRFRLRQLDRRSLDCEEADDIKKSLEQDRLQGCTEVRGTYLRTTARRHILNFDPKRRSTTSRSESSWDKAINGWCVVNSRDVWDHIAFLFGTGEDAVHQECPYGRIATPEGKRRRLVTPAYGERDTDMSIESNVCRAMEHIWHEGECDWHRIGRDEQLTARLTLLAGLSALLGTPADDFLSGPLQEVISNHRSPTRMFARE
jgi:hypothetical protein